MAPHLNYTFAPSAMAINGYGITFNFYEIFMCFMCDGIDVTYTEIRITSPAGKW